MKQEELFTTLLNETVENARENGNCVSQDFVQEKFAQMNFNEEQMQLVYDYLLKHKIGIDRPVELDDYITEEEKSYLDNYLAELKELPEYSDGEKEAYAMRCMAGEIDAQGKLIECYLNDVVSIAKLYAGQGVLLEDLIGEGNLALTMGVTMLGALEKASEAQGMLGKMMMDAMEELIAERGELDKEEQKVLAKINKVEEKVHEMHEAYGRNITVEELAEESKMSEKYIREAMKLSGNQIEFLED